MEEKQTVICNHCSAEIEMSEASHSPICPYCEQKIETQGAEEVIAVFERAERIAKLRSRREAALREYTRAEAERRMTLKQQKEQQTKYVLFAVGAAILFFIILFFASL